MGPFIPRRSINRPNVRYRAIFASTSQSIANIRHQIWRKAQNLWPPGGRRLRHLNTSSYYLATNLRVFIERPLLRFRMNSLGVETQLGRMHQGLSGNLETQMTIFTGVFCHWCLLSLVSFMSPVPLVSND